MTEIYTIPPALVESVVDEAQETRSKLEALLQAYSRSDFDIAELLHRIKKNGYYSPYNTFKEYSETLALRPQKARYLARIVEVMEALNIPREVYEPIGKSKLRLITSLDPNGIWTNPENEQTTPMSVFIAAFVEKGLEMSMDEIRQHVQTLKGLSGPDELVFFRTSVKKAAMVETIRPALELAKNQLGTLATDKEGVAIEPSDGRALEVIAVNFLNDPANIFLGEASD